MISTQDLTKVYETGTVAVDRFTCSVSEGEFVVLLGPTGCGKTTVLRMIAGLVRPTSGQIWIAGRLVNDVPVKDRGVAMVFQDLALYPHLTVEENIAFPLRMTRATDAQVAARVREVADHLGIGALLGRRPGQLSGGERQRVATARAIVRQPTAFLLDEPLSNLDAALRAELRTELAQLARRLGVTTLYVTHDQTEALTMADRIAVLRRGVLAQIGPPEQVYGDPETVFVAGFLGTPRTNLLQGAVYAEPGRGLLVDLGGQVLEFAWSDPRASALAPLHTQRVTVGLRPEALRPVAPGTVGALAGTVKVVEHLGHEALVHLDTGSVPTHGDVSQLDRPERDGGQHLAELLGPEPDTGGALRHTLARMRPRRPEPPATARTQYGFYPTYDPEPGAEASPLGDVVVRVGPVDAPRVGDTLALAVDLAQLLLFDRAGNRIRFGTG